MMGTPKTLVSAIQAGLATPTDKPGMVHLEIKRHVRDFLAQKFGAAILQAESCNDKFAADKLHKLFKLIVGES